MALCPEDRTVTTTFARAQKAVFDWHVQDGNHIVGDIPRLHEIIASAIQSAIDEESERCARLADNEWYRWWNEDLPQSDKGPGLATARRIASAIRGDAP